MEIRKIESNEEIWEIVNIQKVIWPFNDIDITPFHIIKALISSNNPIGYCSGAFDDNKLIGFLLCFNQANGKSCVVHQIGVIPKWRNKGIMSKLLLAGITEMGKRSINYGEWTFDPFELNNANIYFNKLGGFGIGFGENYYTFMPANNSQDSGSEHRFICKFCKNTKESQDIRTKNYSKKEEIIVPMELAAFTKYNKNDLKERRSVIAKQLNNLINIENYMVISMEKQENSFKYILVKE